MVATGFELAKALSASAPSGLCDLGTAGAARLKSISAAAATAVQSRMSQQDSFQTGWTHDQMVNDAEIARLLAAADAAQTAAELASDEQIARLIGADGLESHSSQFLDPLTPHAMRAADFQSLGLQADLDYAPLHRC